MREKWAGLGQYIDFSVSCYFGGGLGDICHRLFDVVWLRILPDLKKTFPHLDVWVFIDSKMPALAKELVETQEGVDHTVAVSNGHFDWTHIAQFMDKRCGVNKENMASMMPEGQNDPETVFRRVVNRIYPMIRFPRVRTITLDDFFQQCGLHPDEFKWSPPGVVTTLEDVLACDDILANATGRVDDFQVVGVHPFTNDPNRACYPMDRWAELVSLLLWEGYVVPVFGAPGERSKLDIPWDDERIIDLTAEIGMRVKAEMVKRCAGIVTIDGSMMHMAWLHAIPTVTLAEADDWDKPGFTADHTGYHWAAALQEPFVKMLRCGRGDAKAIMPQQLIAEVQAIEDKKSQTRSPMWKGQHT